jgi:hypothetical protein
MHFSHVDFPEGRLRPPEGLFALSVGGDYAGRRIDKRMDNRSDGSAFHHFAIPFDVKGAYSQTQNMAA